MYLTLISLAFILIANMVLFLMIRHNLRSLKTLKALKKAGSHALSFTYRPQLSETDILPSYSSQSL